MFLKDERRFENFIFNHRRFSISKNVAHINTMAHFYKVFVRRLFTFTEQNDICITTICLKLTYDGFAGKHNIQLAFQKTKVI